MIFLFYMKIKMLHNLMLSLEFCNRIFGCCMKGSKEVKYETRQEKYGTD